MLKFGIQGYTGYITVAISIGVFLTGSAVRKCIVERDITVKDVDRIGCTR